jgi:uncharacterized protein (TIGR03435 family)
MKLLVGTVIVFFMAASVHGQNQPKPAFEVVSIKPSPEPASGQGYTVACRGGPGSNDPGIYRCTHMSLANLITDAYGIAHYQLSGPDWMRGERFEIAAKVPEGASKGDLKLMLQNMLADRFKLAVHHEARDMPKYDLVLAKGGPRLQRSADEPPPSATHPDVGPPPGPPKRDAEGYPILTLGRAGMAIMDGKARMFNPKMSLDQLAWQLGVQLGKPVTNATGLEENYAIGIYWQAGSMRVAPPSPDGAGAAVAQEPDGPTFEQAVQQQLGLKLEAKKGPVDVIVVDHVEKIPLEN